MLATLRHLLAHWGVGAGPPAQPRTRPPSAFPQRASDAAPAGRPHRLPPTHPAPARQPHPPPSRRIVPYARRGEVAVDQLPLPRAQHAEPAFDEFSRNWDAACAEAHKTGESPKLMKVIGSAP